jgi:hypothetical protein
MTALDWLGSQEKAVPRKLRAIGLTGVIGPATVYLAIKTIGNG